MIRIRVILLELSSYQNTEVKLGGLRICRPINFRISSDPLSPCLRTEFTQPRSFCLLFGDPFPPPTVDVIYGSPLNYEITICRLRGADLPRRVQDWCAQVLPARGHQAPHDVHRGLPQVALRGAVTELTRWNGRVLKHCDSNHTKSYPKISDSFFTRIMHNCNIKFVMYSQY